MLTPTPDLTLAELDDALGNVDQGVWAAWDEIIKRLERTLPVLIERKNTEFGYAAGKGILVPRAYGVTPASASDDYVNTVTVRVRTDKTPGGGTTYLNESSVEIFSVEKKSDSRLQIECAQKRAGLIFAALAPVLRGCINRSGKKVYSQLTPLAQDDLPSDSGWDKYSGALCRFEMVQDQSCNGWEVG